MLLPCALKDNRLVSIQQVESGIRCDCTCPGCGLPVIAKKGKVKVHHFAHTKGGICNGALETALHMKAKTFLKAAKRFAFPPMNLFNGVSIHPKIESEELKLQQQAIAKPIKHYRSKYGDQFIVKNCPLEKRKWKHPQINNHSFAHVFQDCLTCPFCFNVDYQRIYRGNQIFQGNPKIVNCFGGDFQATCTR